MWLNMAPAAVSSATFALVIVDTVNGIMVLSTWLAETLEKRRRKEEERRRKEVERIRKEVERIRLEGKVAAESARMEATLEVQNRWEEWNRRREAAAMAGEEFTEPPPGATPEGDHSHRN